MRPAILGSQLRFPDPQSADSDGLVAVGGDLSAPRLRLAYRSGVFPWTVEPVTWWSPDPRAVLELDGLHVSRSLARVLRRGEFRVTADQAFAEVMAGCAAPGPGRPTTWITPEFVRAYCALHQQGWAHSLECWQGASLAGGIYGVAIGGFFAGESMFHRAANASKVALVCLVEHLRRCGFALFDIQMLTPITSQLGGIEIPRREYLRRLRQAIAMERTFPSALPTAPAQGQVPPPGPATTGAPRPQPSAAPKPSWTFPPGRRFNR
jgi:leucyl/phenylalanyl-tRNA--protein transferase